jgi:hypothetical protein
MRAQNLIKEVDGQVFLKIKWTSIMVVCCVALFLSFCLSACIIAVKDRN